MISKLNINEILEWSKFCSECFNTKENPPTPNYFKQHYINSKCIDFVLLF